LILNQTLNLNFNRHIFFFTLPVLTLGPCSYIFVLFCLYIISYSLNKFQFNFYQCRISFIYFTLIFILFQFHFHVSFYSVMFHSCSHYIWYFLFHFIPSFLCSHFFLFYCVIIFSCNSCSSTDLISFFYFMSLYSISFQFFLFILVLMFSFYSSFSSLFIAFHSLFLFIFYFTDEQKVQKLP